MSHDVITTTIPHASFGDPDCCGCLCGIIRGDEAAIMCNECGAVLATVQASELQRTFDRMELSLDLASAKCPHCGAVHIVSGFSRLVAFICDNCGKGVTVRES